MAVVALLALPLLAALAEHPAAPVRTEETVGYPPIAAGWGPDLGGGLMASRWAEDWSAQSAAGRAPRLKAVALANGAVFTASGEIRLRQVASDHPLQRGGGDVQQTQLRAVAGADLRFNPNLRIYLEAGTGQVVGQRGTAAPNFQNAASLQQFFVDLRSHRGANLVGAMLGRQEFADGPRQLLSLSDGPNLHRSWNGLRLYVHRPRQRFGVFDLRATRPGRGGFDEAVEDGEALRGVNASFVLSPGSRSDLFLDPFWIHSTHPRHRVGMRSGPDERDTVGARLWGRRGDLRFDWTAVRQSGRSVGGRGVDAWGLFMLHSLPLTDARGEPRLSLRIDLASGGADAGTAAVRDFNPLYASSSHLGEGQFLALSNLAVVAPGITVSPASGTTLAFEYGHARRLDAQGWVYAAGMRPYPGTRGVGGHHIGDVARLTATWSRDPRLSLRLSVEHLRAGSVLRAAGQSSGTYGHLDATLRY